MTTRHNQLQVRPLIAVVDDDPPMRQALERLLAVEEYRCHCMSSAEELLDWLETDCPNCLILDVRMGGMSGLELQDELKRRSIEVPVIMMSGFGDIPNVVRAMKNGAIDFLEKPFADTRLLALVQAAIAKGQQRLAHQRAKIEVRRRLGGLTRREREVMDLLVLGRNAKQIGNSLGISSKTVDIHRTRVLSKAGVENVVELTNLVNGSNL